MIMNFSSLNKDKIYDALSILIEQLKSVKTRNDFNMARLRWYTTVQDDIGIDLAAQRFEEIANAVISEQTKEYLEKYHGEPKFSVTPKEAIENGRKIAHAHYLQKSAEGEDIWDL